MTRVVPLKSYQSLVAGDYVEISGAWFRVAYISNGDGENVFVELVKGGQTGFTWAALREICSDIRRDRAAKLTPAERRQHSTEGRDGP